MEEKEVKKSRVKSKVKLKDGEKVYTLREDHPSGKKILKAGTSIVLTVRQADYLKSLNKI